MRRCVVPACPNPVTARGWCMAHYTRWLRTGDVGAHEPVRATPKDDTCSVEGCGQPVSTRGWCQMHYKRWRRHGDVRAGEPKLGSVPRLCEVEGCKRPHDAKGLCHGHHQRVLRNGDVLAELPLSPRKQPDICAVTGCTRPTHGKGLCRTHGARVERHGDVLAGVPVKIAKGQGWLSHGYRYVPVPQHLRHLSNGESESAEHRLIMAIHLDRPLRRDEVVHHVNGVRTDNRIENLELWSTYHPKGQRIADKVAFALEVLRRYRPDLLDERRDQEQAAP